MTYRRDIPAPPSRIAALPVHRGYPVPWFVAWLNEVGDVAARGEGTPEFRVLAPRAVDEALSRNLCWICGQPRPRYAAFVAGPMCAINRTSSEPPSHPECAGWAAHACPFLTRPQMRRREVDLPEEAEAPAGLALMRNPGVALVWCSTSWRVWYPPGGGRLLNMGDPDDIAWLCEGRPATRDEVEASILSGLPPLRERAGLQGEQAVAELERRTAEVLSTLAPRAA